MKNILSIFLLVITMSNVNGQNLLIKKGHQQPINYVHYSPDGSRLYSASEDKTIKEWDVKTGFDVKTFSSHTAAVKSFAVTKDGNTLISGDSEGNIILWSTADASVIHKIKAHDQSINSIKLFPDEKSFLTGSDDKTIKEWRISDGSLVKKIEEGIGSWVRAIGISPDGKRAIMGGHKANSIELLLVDLEKGIVIDDLIKHWMDPATRGLIKAYTYAVLSPVALTMNLAKGNVGKDMLHFWINDFNNIEFTHDGTSILVSQNMYFPMTAEKGKEEEEGSTTVWLINLAENKNAFGDVKDMKRWIINAPGARALFNEDQTKIIANQKYAVKIYDYINTEFPEDQKEAQGYEPPVIQEFQSGIRRINSIALSPDFRTVASTNDDMGIDLWDINTGRLIRTLGGEVKSALSIDVMPDGKHILVGSADQNMAMWDITTGQIARIYDRSSDVTHIDISSDGKSAVTTAMKTEFFKLWDLQTGRLKRSFLGNKENFIWAKFNNDDPDNILAATDDQKIRNWSIVEGKPKNKINSTIEQLEDKFTFKDLTAEVKGFTVTIKKGGSQFQEYEQKALITDAVFSIDGKYLITTNELGQINLYNIEANKFTLTMSLVGFDQFVSYTPDFYYTSSKRAANVMAFQSENNILPFEQLELKNNRPDIILERLGYSSPELIKSYRAAYEKRLQRLGFDDGLENTENITLPEVSIDFSNIPFATDEQAITFEAVANDAFSQIIKFNIYVNDVPVYGLKGFTVENPSKSVQKEFGINLSAGINTIKVSAVNEKGYESITKSFDVTYNKPYFKPQLYILSIGVSDYADNNYDLTFAAKDASDIVNSIGKSTIYEQVNELLITDSQVTRDRILKAKSFLSKASVDDVVIIFIAGHGVLDEDFTYYFGTYDMDFSSPAGKGLSYEALQGLLDGITSRKKILFMDTCHSGELDAEDVEKSNKQIQKSGAIAFRSGGSAYTSKGNEFGLQNTLELSKNLFGDMKKGTGATIISAAGGTEYAMEGLRSKNGLFTACLIQGITTRGADLDRDRNYSVSEFQKYIYNKVLEYSGGAQTPTSRAENISNDFHIY